MEMMELLTLNLLSKFKYISFLNPFLKCTMKHEDDSS